MRKLRVAVDMDETIADSLHNLRAWLEAEFGYRWAADELAGVPLRRLLAAEHVKAMEDYLHLGDFFADLPVLDGAQAALRDLAERHEIYITTAAMEFPASMPFKLAWLREHFPFLDPLKFVFCGDKRIINADVLIDDHARHFEGFVGQGLLFTAPHNLGVAGYPRLERWDDAPRVLERLPLRAG